MTVTPCLLLAVGTSSFTVQAGLQHTACANGAVARLAAAPALSARASSGDVHRLPVDDPCPLKSRGAQVRWRRGGAPSGSACPFCKGLFAVTYRGPLTAKDVAVLAAERAALAAAQQRSREVRPCVLRAKCCLPQWQASEN